MRLVLTWAIFAIVLMGCQEVTSLAAPTPDFELREFIVKEEKKEATDYSKAYNSFKGTGTLVAKNVSSDRNLVVLLEIHDSSAGADPEPQYAYVLFRGGLGKVEIAKSEYEVVSPRPQYRWRVLGWHELQKGNLQVF